MRNWVGLSLCAAAVVGLALVAKPVPEVERAVSIPFWSLHAVAPAAGDTPAVLALRTAHAEPAEAIVVAAR